MQVEWTRQRLRTVLDQVGSAVPRGPAPQFGLVRNCLEYPDQLQDPVGLGVDYDDSVINHRITLPKWQHRQVVTPVIVQKGEVIAVDTLTYAISVLPFPGGHPFLCLSWRHTGRVLLCKAGRTRFSIRKRRPRTNDGNDREESSGKKSGG